VRASRSRNGPPILPAIVLLSLLFGGCGGDTAPRLDPCATPSFDPPPGLYERTVLVSILCETTDAVIRFTIDGSEPGEDSQAFLHPFAISASRTIKARAWKDGFSPSRTATVTYELRCAIDVTAPPDGASLPAGSQYAISWTSTICTGPVRIELLWNGSVCDTIAAGAADTGVYDWTVEGCGVEEGEYRIRVTDIASGATDLNGGPFTIVASRRISWGRPRARRRPLRRPYRPFCGRAGPGGACATLPPRGFEGVVRPPAT
jgi:hypothetical protein